MPTLAAGEQAPFFARYGYAFYGQTRYGYFQMTPFILVNGVDRTADVRFEEGVIEWTQRDRDQRQELYFELKEGAAAPAMRASVKLAIGDINRVRFQGLALDCAKENATGASGKTACGITCEDRQEILNGVLITGRWDSGERYGEIAVEVVDEVNTKLGASFTTTNIDTITSPLAGEYEVVDKAAFQVLQELATLASGSGTPWYVRLGWDDDVHFYDTESVIDAVRSITEDGNGNLDSGHRSVVPSSGGVPIRTRVYVEGAKSQTTSAVAAGATNVPVEDVARFKGLVDELGGTVWARSGSVIFSFTGTSASSGPGNLTGVPATGAGSIGSALEQGAEIRIRVQRDDAAAQATYGVIEHKIDAGDDGAKLCIARGDADLAVNSTPPEGGEFDVYGDVHAIAGSELAVMAPNALGQSTTFTVREIRRQWVGAGDQIDAHVVYGDQNRRLTEFWQRVKLEP